MLHFILFHVLSLSLAFLQIYFQCLNLNLSMANNRLMSHLVNINLTSNLYSDIFFDKRNKNDCISSKSQFIVCTNIFMNVFFANGFFDKLKEF